ncbi:AI-2E family transporter [Virgibacillus sp. SK37]|uniref:AI-2E family transporter n=1 Tax=Virgibacillus sp. SK37 TaxID=403957 RepID=UPI0006937AA8|nr:AI-2E family transporter [Virgibacillus sp. SK37]
MKSFFNTRFIKFLGGRDLLFGLLVLFLLGITIYIYDKVSFIFHPLLVIISTLAAPIILALIAYYLVKPIIHLLEKLRINRLGAIIIILLGISGLLTGIILLTAPAIQSQIKELAVELPKYLKEMGNGIKSWISHSFLAPYYDDAYQWVTANLSELPSKISNYFGGAMEGIRNVASTITQVVIAIITFPFVLFFLLKDGDRFKEHTLKLLPPQFRNDANQILINMDRQVGTYIQGQIIVATCIGVLLFIGYLIIGLPYAITLAIIAAVTSVVPYLGPMIAISPAIIIAIVNSPFMLVKMIIVWAAVQFFEGHFITPNVMGRNMHIHPLTIILILLVAGNLFGLIGVILGIPGYAILKVIVVHMFQKLKGRHNEYYGDKYGTYK